MIEAIDVSKRYGPDQVLDGASVKVSPGELALLSGDNGSGKTTLLHILVGLRRPDSGVVRLNGHPLWFEQKQAWRRVRENLGFMPQILEFPDHSRVDRLCRFYARVRSLPYKAIVEWLEKVGLSDETHTRLGELSGGMKQRLGLALTLFHDPSIIVMDEPGNNLDPTWRNQFRTWLAEEAAGGKSVLVTSQLHAEWNGLVRRLVCERGTVLELGSGDNQDLTSGNRSQADKDLPSRNGSPTHTTGTGAKSPSRERQLGTER